MTKAQRRRALRQAEIDMAVYDCAAWLYIQDGGAEPIGVIIAHLDDMLAAGMARYSPSNRCLIAVNPPVGDRLNRQERRQWDAIQRKG